jgi:hypothetical protein
MLKTYAARYGSIALVISIVFVALYTVVEMIEPYIPP